MIACGICIAVNPRVAVSCGLYVGAGAVVWYGHLDDVVCSVAFGLLVAVLGDAHPHVVDGDDEAVDGGEGTDGTTGQGDGDCLSA